MNAIETHGLRKYYKEIKAVDDLDLEVLSGELFALLGVNGAGKTTTIKMLCCLAAPTSGEALVGGYSIKSDVIKVKEKIAVVPQETAVAANLTAEENLKLMAGLHGLSADAAEKKIKELSSLLHLEDILKRRAGKLSGGWQRRLSIAMALVSEPEILFLDEPTLGLDVLARSDLWDVIRQLKGRITIVLTTHYMEEAEALSDRIGIMREGKLLCVGTADELKASVAASTLEEAFIRIVKEGRV